MLRALLKSLRTGVVTSRYPAQAAPAPVDYRGAPELVAGGSFAALPSPAICPSGAISGDADTWTLDLARCVFCGRCGSSEGPVRISRATELARRRREDLLVRAHRDGDRIALTDVPDLEERVADRIHRTLGRSLHLRHLDAGSCNACDWELTALLAPHYDIRRLGIDFVASPRHADGVIVTGPVTRNLEAAVRRTWEATPEPRVVIAVGACAASGGIAGPSYTTRGGVGDVLPVDVFIPGCPPRPEAILFGILQAVGRLSATG